MPERLCLPPPKVELEVRKIDMVKILYYTENSNYYIQFRGLMPTKVPIIWKKASSRSCSEIQSLPKNQWALMSISITTHPRVWLGLQRLICFKYYNVLKLEIVVTSTIKLISATRNLNLSIVALLPWTFSNKILILFFHSSVLPSFLFQAIICNFGQRVRSWW